MSRGAVVSLAPGPLLTRSSCRLRLHWHLLSDIVARALNPDSTAGRTPDEHMRSPPHLRSEEHTSELQSIMRISYAVCCLTKKICIPHRIHICINHIIH